MQVKVFEALKVPSDTARVSATEKKGLLRGEVMPLIYDDLEREDQCDLDEVKNSKGHKMLVMYFDLNQDRILQVMLCKKARMLVHLEGQRKRRLLRP